MKKYFFFSLFIFLFNFSTSVGQTRWSFELHGGVATNLRLPLIIRQTGYPDIRIEKAHFTSEPLIDPYYWDWRFTKWFGKKSIEFEAIHHKLYLVNKPAEVQRFGISHGFNMLFLNHSRQLEKIILRGGLGSVLLHAESTVRNMKYPEGPGFDRKGYVLRGISVNLAVAKQLKFGRYFFINAEGKITGSIVNAPIVNGSARVYNIAFQLILGPGVNWAVKD